MIGGITGVFFRNTIKPDGSHKYKIQEAIELLGPVNSQYRTFNDSDHVQFARMVLPFYSSEQTGFFPQINNCVITASAIINNTKDLRGKLDLLYPAADDARTILQAYLKWGNTCLDYLEGKFGFAIWDGNQQTLLCAKSATGGVDLVYYLDDEKFIFGTQIKCIISLLGYTPPLNVEFIAEHIDNITGNKRSTIYQDIHHLPSGYAITVNASNFNEFQYWKPGDADAIVFKNNADYAEAGTEVLTTILKGYADTGLKIGLQTGGGLKTACIASHLQPLQDHPLTGVSYILPEGYQGELVDEKSYTDALADRLNMDLHYVNESVFPDPYDEDVERKMIQQDSPVVNPVGSDHYLVYGKMKELGVQLCLTPESKSIDWTGKEVIPSLILEGRYWEAWKLHRQTKSGSFLRNGLIPALPEGIISIYRKMKKPKQRQWLTHPDIVKKINLEKKTEQYNMELTGQYPAHAFMQDQLRSIKQRMDFGKKYISTQEYRYGFVMISPLSDRRLIDYSLSIPSGQFVLNGETRSLIKRMLEGKVPELVYRTPSKVSYPADMRLRWLNAKPHVFKHFTAISTTADVWNYIDKLAAIQVYTATKNAKNYGVWLNNRQHLNKVILLNRFLNLI